tara:strand:+ start:400 stop:996 length:597 start_codon:yes stop_codon:yes gene_type:complete
MVSKQKSFTDKQMELALRLTPLQRKFIIELVKPKNSQRQAYLAAGGKAKTELAQDASATQIFRNLKVRAFYESLMETKTLGAMMERDEAVAILSNNARVKMTDIAVFALREVGRDAEENPIMQTVWTMKDSDDIDPAVLSCIKSVTMTKQGPKIELHDQQAAIKQLSVLEGWEAPKKTELSGKDGEAIVITQIERKII